MAAEDDGTGVDGCCLIVLIGLLIVFIGACSGMSVRAFNWFAF